MSSWSRIANVFRGERVIREIDEELESHIEEAIAQGRDPAEARRALGPALRHREESLDARVMPFFENLRRDLRFALRQLRKNPAFTATAVLILALGIGASVAIFAFVDAALIKPLPYRDPGRLVHVTESAAMIPRANLSYQDYVDWKKLNTVFSSFDVWAGTGYLMRMPDGIHPVMAARVSDGFFRTLGIAPMLGRDFYAGEAAPGAPHTVMLTYAAWRKWFGGRHDVVGQAVTLSDASYTVIGVLPPDFQFAPRGNAEMWTPIQDLTPCEKRRSCHNLNGVARLNDGVSVAAALANMKAIAHGLEARYSDSNRGQGASVVPLSEVIVGDVRPILLTLFGAAALLLLIAYVNVTSLLLARSESRRREIAVRGALGASASRLVRQFATEGLVLVTAGSALGLVAAAWTMRLPARFLPPVMMAGAPYLQGLGFNIRVLGFSAAISLAAVLLFSITPMLRLSLPEMRRGLTEGSRGSSGTLWRRFGPNLVVVELAIAMVLLAGAGLLGKSFYRLLHVDLGFQPDHLASVQLVAPEAAYASDERAARLGREITDRIAALPGVRAVGLTGRLPLTGNGNTNWIRIVGRPYNGAHNEVNERDVSDTYFATLRVKLLRGRYFTEADNASTTPVVIINQAFANKYFPGEDPIGRKIGDTELSPKSIREIVGVVDDLKEGSLDSDNWPAEYLPFSQSPGTYFAVIVRTWQDEGSVLPALVAAIHEIDFGIGTFAAETMTARVSDSPTAYLHRSSAWLVGGFAALALLLGVVGLYGVIAYSVSQRTREIGVRMALGARPASVYRLVLSEASRLIGVGMGIGLACSLAAATLMRGLLFGVRAWDASTLAVVAAGLGMCALAASYIPARRAASVNPVEALRAE